MNSLKKKHSSNYGRNQHRWHSKLRRLNSKFENLEMTKKKGKLWDGYIEKIMVYRQDTKLERIEGSVTIVGIGNIGLS